MAFEQGKLILYQSEDGQTKVNVRLKGETVWLTMSQMAELFDRDKSVISRHLRNIFQTGELVREAVVAKNATTALDGKIYQVDWYNLDAIISVGYRVNSIQGTRFRIWATSVLKEHLVSGYTLNQKRLAKKGLDEARQMLDLLGTTLKSHNFVTEEGEAVLALVNEYARTWQLLWQYDEDSLTVPVQKQNHQQLLPELHEIRAAIHSLKETLLQKGEATDLFGQERGDALAGIFGAIQQTFAGQDLYPTIEEKAAHLLYFVIKDHPFTDGNKRIASFLFLLFLRQNISENCLPDSRGMVALTLLIAASAPEQKELLIRLVVNLLVKEENVDHV